MNAAITMGEDDSINREVRIGNLNSDNSLATVNEYLEYLSNSVVEVLSRYALRFVEFLAPFSKLTPNNSITNTEHDRQKS